MYLKGFCRNGNLWVYDRQGTSYERRNPKTLATRRHFYSVVNPDGTKDPTVEHALGSIEDAAAPVIGKIEAGAGISMEEKFHLALCVALMKFRVPMFEDWFERFGDEVGKKLINGRYQSDKDVQRQLDAWGKNDSSDPNQAKNIFEGLQSARYKIKPNTAARLKQMLQLALGISREISLMEWNFAEVAEGASFVTSDNPVLVLYLRDNARVFGGVDGRLRPLLARRRGFRLPGYPENDAPDPERLPHHRRLRDGNEEI